MHWACSKITASSNIPDATLLEVLLDKVLYFSNIYYCESVLLSIVQWHLK